MYYYVDESGNTGSNLFDPSQPALYYGVVGCRKNLDVVAERMLQRLRSELGVDRLHAAQIGVDGLKPVYQAFTKFQKTNDVRMHFYKVSKSDHAIISFFDQVFDSGMNDAVSGAHYFTPMRYLLLLKLAYLFDDELAKKAWAARLMQSRQECSAKAVEVCEELRNRIHVLPDARSRELIDAALVWAVANMDKIEYGVSNRESALQISPNLVGFQQVLQGIADQAASMKRPVRSIVVDRQSEFNTAQQWLNNVYRLMRKAKLPVLHGMPSRDLSSLPDSDVEFRPGDESAGLEMVDIYVWTMKRIEEDRSMSDEGRSLIHGQRHRGRRDEVSLHGISRRWEQLLDIPEPDEERKAAAKAIVEEIDRQRAEAVRGLY